MSSSDEHSGRLADDDLTVLLAQRAPRRRARSTTILIVLLIFVLGMIIGVPLGRMSAQLGQTVSEQGQPSGDLRPQEPNR